MGVLLLCFLAFAFCAGFTYISGVDVGFHIRTGAEILDTGHIPSRNTFAYTTPETPWLLHQWWPGILFYGVDRLAGVAGLIVLKALLGTTIFALVYLAARDTASGRMAPFWAATAGILLGRTRFFVRPLMMSGLFFALLLWLDGRLQKSRRWQWLGVPVLMAVWANTHAGVAYGFVLLGALSAGEWIDWVLGRVRGRTAPIGPLFVRPVGIALAALLSVVSVQVINPSGARVLWLPFTYFLDPFWQSLIYEFSGSTWANAKLFYVSLAVLIVLQAVTWRSFRTRTAVTAAVFAVLTLRSQRCVLFYAIAFVPYAAQLLSSVGGRVSVRKSIAHTAALMTCWLALVGGVLVRDQTFRFGIGMYPAYHPMSIYRFIQRKVPPQNLFNTMRYGAGILWHLYPEFRPFIDGRCEAYTPEFWKTKYIPVERGDPLWHRVFREYGITGALLRMERGRKSGRLVHALAVDPDWAVVAYDDFTVLFLRRTPRNRPVIEEDEYKLVWPGNRDFNGVTVSNAPLALSEAERALALSPNCVYAKAATARVALVRGEYARAARLYASVMEGNYRFGSAYLRDYGYAMYMDGKLDGADRVFEDMAERGREVAYALYMRHLIAVKRGRLDEADELIRNAAEADASYADRLTTWEATVGGTLRKDEH